MSTDLGELFFTPAYAALSRHTPVPPAVRRLMVNAAVRLLDSTMLVEDSLRPFAVVEESRVKTPLPQFPVLAAVAQLVEQVGSEGFGPHAVRFFGLLGSVMVNLAGSPAQIELVSAWVDAGLTGTFCMTDRGGPLGSQWRSAAVTGDDPKLTVDKIWAMNACDAGFAIVVVRRGNSMVLAPVLVPPEAFARCDRQPSGAPFLDGHLGLGNVKFQCDLDTDWVMSKGGPIAPKIFLSTARPWLIQALCAHVGWLAKHGRVLLDEAAHERIAFLAIAARNQAALGVFDRFSEDQAMALKWIANETWLDLVTTGAVKSADDQRDLLAFTKMEGSSYRCFLEIHERNKRMRHVEA